jgi:hypothetical protein
MSSDNQGEVAEGLLMKVKIEVKDDNGRTYSGELELEQIGQRERRKHVEKTNTKNSSSLPQRIIRLREKGYFASPRVFTEVHTEIQKEYPCDPDRVRVALIRLQRNKQLRKTSKNYGGKDLTAYAW